MSAYQRNFSTNIDYIRHQRYGLNQQKGFNQQTWGSDPPKPWNSPAAYGFCLAKNRVEATKHQQKQDIACQECWSNRQKQSKTWIQQTSKFNNQHTHTQVHTHTQTWGLPHQKSELNESKAGIWRWPIATGPLVYRGVNTHNQVILLWTGEYHVRCGLHLRVIMIDFGVFILVPLVEPRTSRWHAFSHQVERRDLKFVSEYQRFLVRVRTGLQLVIVVDMSERKCARHPLSRPKSRYPC